MGIIHMLDKSVSDQIAAGEVVERPVSAVKELVENAMDAHAQNISVDIVNGGLDLIRISDDGDGFYKEDLLLATKRHATSKIEHFNDIYALSTFGFRGEALASVAAISRLTIISGRDVHSPSNVLHSICGKDEPLTLEAPRKGTIIEVRDLYFNVPARKKFVKSNSRENALILDVITKFAIGSPDINFRLTIDGETRFSSNQLHSVEDVLIYAYGPADDGISHGLHNDFYQHLSVEFWFYPPSNTRKNKNQMVYFVNGRLVESADLDKIVAEAVYTLIPKGRFPICMISLQVPAFFVDVNVHPAKRFVTFTNLDEWKDALVTLLKEDLWLSRLNNSFSVMQQGHESKNNATVPLSEGEDTTSPSSVERPLRPPSAPAQTLPFVHESRDKDYQSRSVKHSSENASGNAEQASSAGKQNNDQAEQGYQQPISPVSDSVGTYKSETQTKENGLTVNELQNLTYIGQLNKSFLLAQDDSNLYIIDQHALHERILYERFMERFDKQKVAIQTLLLPMEIHLSVMQEQELVEHILNFSSLGFALEKGEGGNYKILSVPLLLSGHVDLEELIKDTLDDLAVSKSDVSLAAIDEQAIIMASCKAAVKAHYDLTAAEVTTLFQQMKMLKNPHTCPHGRPIVMNISMNEIYHFFKRGSY